MINPASLPNRQSPLHDALSAMRPTWIELAGMPAPVDFGHPGPERVCARRLGICDFSAFPRLLAKGPNAAEWLAGQQLPIPDRTYGVAPLPRGGLLVRTGGAEFFLEDGLHGGVASRLQSAGLPPAGCSLAARQDAAIVLCGERAVEVLSQTCGYEFRRGQPEFVMTRVAGVSCAVFERTIDDVSCFQLWLDGTYGPYLWETLVEVAREAGGNIVGLGCFFPELAPVAASSGQ